MRKIKKSKYNLKNTPKWVGTLTIAIISSLITMCGNIFVQAIVSQDGADQAAREKRDIFYSDFLEYANNYHTSTCRLRDCLANSDYHDENNKCGEEINNIQNARSDFLYSKSKVLIYGSAEAVNKINAISDTLPDPSDRTSTGWPNLAEIIAYNASPFGAAWKGFSSVACKELLANPRAGCDEI